MQECYLDDSSSGHLSAKLKSALFFRPNATIKVKVHAQNDILVLHTEESGSLTSSTVI